MINIFLSYAYLTVYYSKPIHVPYCQCLRILIQDLLVDYLEDVEVQLVHFGVAVSLPHEQTENESENCERSFFYGESL